MKLRYRSDIDGLRAIAVLSVVLFHFRLHTFRGGFVGVDIFFVISGYLISKIIINEAFDGTFSIISFYERRARRILPALFAVSIAVTYGAYCLFSPPELIYFAKSLWASTLFGANIFFFETLNYFSPAATRLPLLHFWSLGVEEQFYLLFPALIIAIHRFWPRVLKPVILVILLASLLASGLLTHQHPEATFYLLPFRAFEFMIGSILAFPSLPAPKGRKTAIAVTSLGLVLLVHSILSLKATMDFPGFLALIPCLGTACVLWGGSGERTWVYAVLSLAPLRAVGRISYSLYLVHWPIIVFGLQLLPNMPPIYRNTIFFGLSIGAAIASYYLIEQPFRTNHFWNRPRIFTFSAFAIAAPLALGGVIVANHGFSYHYTQQDLHILNMGGYDWHTGYRGGQCFLDPDQRASAFDVSKCLPESKEKRAVLWGDSTAADLYVGLSGLSKSYGFSIGQATASACAPIVGSDVPDRPFCKEFNDKVLLLLLKHHPDLVILSAQWPNDPNDIANFQKTVAKLKDAKIPMMIIGRQPQYDASIPLLIIQKTHKHKGHHTFYEPILPDVIPINNRIASIAKEDNIPFISILKTICTNGRCLITLPNGDPLEFDGLHFTGEGSQFIAEKIASRIFATAGSQEDAN